LETAYAKSYRTLQSAVNLAIAEHGDISTWDWKDSMSTQERDAFVKKYFVPYLSVMKFCPTDNSVQGCFPSGNYKLLNGSLSNENPSAADNPRMLLADGSSLRFQFRNGCISKSNSNRCLDLHVDTNGHKKPNTVGRDMLGFGFFPFTGQFVPFGTLVPGTYNSDTNEFTRYTEEQIYGNCAENGSNGWICSARLVIDGFKMNY